ncbi:hypothetical protein N9D61_05650 [Planktomarina sp.]|nr:hypothetical protein [Planktomarina sp.]
MADGYSVHFLGLSPTHVLKTPVLELGWFAMHPDQVNQDIYSMAWGYITQLLDQNAV